MNRIAAIMLAWALLLTSGLDSDAQPHRHWNYGVFETDSLGWRDHCILPDPVSHQYYLVCSAGRSIIAYKSADLRHWEGPTTIYSAPDDVWGDIPINGIWAPELHYYNGKYYIFCTFDTSSPFSEQWRNWNIPGRVRRGSQVLWSDSPEGPFHTFAPHSTMPVDMMTIDGTLWVEDGVPYMVYVHEWVQVTDGAIGCVRLKDDLSDIDGEPHNLFRASYVNSTWGAPIRPDGNGYVTDGPYLCKGKTGKLYMIWTTNNSCGIAISDSGKIDGPWRQQDKALYVGGGHGMIFRSFEGGLELVLHAPYWGVTHPHIFNLEDTGETLIITGEYGKPNIAPKPLYRDPVYDGAADPEIIRNRATGEWHMFYTNRRANIEAADGVSWVHGGPIGIATSPDLTHWTYLQDANIGYKPDREPTYWAPSVVDDGTEYHMFLTYVPGVFADWNHPRHIVHLVSDDLLDWKFQSELKLMSDKVIDADVMRLPDGTWRMWYNQEPGGKLIAYADSPDLYVWTDHGLVKGIGNCEGPKAFEWKGSWWLICDEWKGFAVYRSSDAMHWTRQKGNILQMPGKGLDDGVHGNHCDVQVIGERAYIFYFTHPDRAEDAAATGNPRRSLIQVAELKCTDGRTITCDRDAQTVIETAE